MKNPDKMSNAELRREVKELREGKCRLNCRTTKELEAELDRLKAAIRAANDAIEYGEGVNLRYYMEDWSDCAPYIPVIESALESA